MRELFRIFDSENMGNLSLIDFKKTLYHEIQMYPNLEDINLLFKKHDINNDGKLK